MLKLSEVISSITVDRLVLVQVGTQLYGLTKPADNQPPSQANAVVFEALALPSALDPVEPVPVIQGPVPNISEHGFAKD